MYSLELALFRPLGAVGRSPAPARPAWLLLSAPQHHYHLMSTFLTHLQCIWVSATWYSYTDDRQKFYFNLCNIVCDKLIAVFTSVAIVVPTEVKLTCNIIIRLVVISEKS